MRGMAMGSFLLPFDFFQRPGTSMIEAESGHDVKWLLTPAPHPLWSGRRQDPSFQVLRFPDVPTHMLAFLLVNLRIPTNPCRRNLAFPLFSPRKGTPSLDGPCNFGGLREAWILLIQRLGVQDQKFQSQAIWRSKKRCKRGNPVAGHSVPQKSR